MLSHHKSVNEYIIADVVINVILIFSVKTIYLYNCSFKKSVSAKMANAVKILRK